MQEEIVVNLKVNPTNFDKTIKAMDDTTKAFSAAEKSVSAFDRALKAVGSVVETVGNIAEGFQKSWRSVQAALTLATVAIGANTKAQQAMGGVTTTFIQQAIQKYIPIVGQIAAVITAAKISYNIWTDAVERNTEIQENNQRMTTATDLIYKRFLDSAVVPLTGWFNKLTTSIKEGLLTWGPWNALGTAALAIAEGQVDTYRKLDEAILKQIEGQNDLAKTLQDINIKLQDNNLKTEDRIKLMEEQRDAQMEILKAEQEVQKLRVSAAAFALTNDLSPEEERQATIKLYQERQKLGAIQLQMDKLEADSKKAINDLKDKEIEKVIKLTQSLSDLQIEFAEFNEYAEGLIDSDTTAADKWLENWQENFEKAKPVFDIALDDIEEFAEEEEKIFAKMDEAAERSARNRIAWQEFGAEGQLGVASELTGAMARLSGENLENQKGWATAQVLVDAAAASIRVWRDAAFPVAIALQAGIVANAAAAISQIQSAQPGQLGTQLNPVVVRPDNAFNTRPTETAAPDFYRVNQSRPLVQPVLVTEDLDAVQNRIRVTEDRSTL